MAAEKSFADNSKESIVVRKGDITEIYMADSGLHNVESFGEFKNLQRLWLNGNKLRKISCLQGNFRLTEIYLQDNLVVDITGALRHLAGLEVLMLQRNQLKHLTDVVHELIKMQRLRVLNLFGNPLAQDYDYRNYVIYNIPSLQRLDRQEILKEERNKAYRRYVDATERIQDTVAFGRRVPTSESRNNQTPPKETTPKCAHWEDSRQDLSLARQQTATLKENSATKRSSSSQEANDESRLDISKETNRRSLMQYSTFDWSAVPLSKERRLSEESKFSPRIVTMYLK